MDVLQVLGETHGDGEAVLSEHPARVAYEEAVRLAGESSLRLNEAEDDFRRCVWVVRRWRRQLEALGLWETPEILGQLSSSKETRVLTPKQRVLRAKSLKRVPCVSCGQIFKQRRWSQSHCTMVACRQKMQAEDRARKRHNQARSARTRSVQ